MGVGVGVGEGLIVAEGSGDGLDVGCDVSVGGAEAVFAVCRLVAYGVEEGLVVGSGSGRSSSGGSALATSWQADSSSASAMSINDARLAELGKRLAKIDMIPQPF